MAQNFEPIKNICAHLNAFHVYADEPSRKVETNHYCAHLSKRLPDSIPIMPLSISGPSRCEEFGC